MDGIMKYSFPSPYFSLPILLIQVNLGFICKKILYLIYMFPGLFLNIITNFLSSECDSLDLHTDDGKVVTCSLCSRAVDDESELNSIFNCRCIFFSFGKV